MLRCDKCDAVVAVTFLPGLSTLAMDKLTRLYERQLGLAHADDTCPYKRDAVAYLDGATCSAMATAAKKLQQKAQDPSPIVPSCFTPYVSPDLVELVESKRPALVFRRQLKELLVRGGDDDYGNNKVAWKNIRLDLPAALRNFKAPAAAGKEDGNSDATTTAAATATTLEEGLVQAFTNVGDSSADQPSGLGTNDNADELKTAAMVFLLGWKPNFVTGGAKTASMECPLCRKSTEIVLSGENDSRDPSTTATTTTTTTGGSSEEEPPAKRSRPSSPGFDPFHSHRHYCPYVCGFPTGGASSATPLWEALARRILAKTTEKATATAACRQPSSFDTEKSEWQQIRALLNSGIVRQRTASAPSG